MSLLTLATAATATAGTDQLTGIAAWAVTIMESLGGLGVAFLIALENLFPPLPSEIVLPLAGFTASQGTSFGLVEAIVWATVGSLVGAWALYGIARLIGRERTRAILNWLPLVKMSDVDKTEAWFHKHDQSTVFFGRMLPIFRSLISLPAGVIKMNFLWFTLLTTAGAAIWNTALVGAGYILGENWHLVEQYVGLLSYVVAALVVVLLGWWVVKRLRANRAA
ncbi:DedA family protein [Trueperella bernardiae]|uniref:DedA family protein n=1 Tax=Trueperella bernardiae TaxID=59561 RepID=UPI002889568B|nr:DedA family protein [Trueperella bernardiae]